MRRHVLFLAAAAVLRGQTVTNLIDHGDPANRIDLVVVSEGYTASELDKFAADANTFASNFFASEVYGEYASYFNVRTVAVASNQSGASHPELNPPVVRDTAFGATYNCQGVVRLICVNNNKVNAVVNALLPANRRDYVFVLVNDPAYGGSGGAILVASTHSAAPEIALHESGHTVGLLADEYPDQPPPCDLSKEPSDANATRETDRAAIKWNEWIDPGTPLPTTTTTLGMPGLYLGADYCPSGMYRPTYMSKMRALGYPFEQINDEQLVRRFYNVVSAIDSWSPSSATVTAQQGDKVAFSVKPLAPGAHTLTTTWIVDGAVIGTGTDLSLNTGQMSAGAYTVTASVRDVTKWVRSDPSDLLADSQTWHLTLTPGMPSALQPSISHVAGAGLSVPPVTQLANGGLFAIFGSGFAAPGVARPVGSADLNGNALPINLAGACVQIASARIPLTYVSATQINAEASGLPATGNVQVTVIANCGTANEISSPPVAMTAAAAAPEFLYLRLSSDGHNPVAAFQVTGGAAVSRGSPAHAGDVITIYAIGFGPTDSSDPPGTIAGSAARTVRDAAVTIGGVSAPVLYAGVTPTYSGLYQVNLVVPNGIAAGDRPIQIRVNGGTSPTGAYLSVR